MSAQFGISLSSDETAQKFVAILTKENSTGYVVTLVLNSHIRAVSETLDVTNRRGSSNRDRDINDY